MFFGRLEGLEVVEHAVDRGGEAEGLLCCLAAGVEADDDALGSGLCAERLAILLVPGESRALGGAFGPLEGGGIGVGVFSFDGEHASASAGRLCFCNDVALLVFHGEASAEVVPIVGIVGLEGYALGAPASSVPPSGKKARAASGLVVFARK